MTAHTFTDMRWEPRTPEFDAPFQEQWCADMGIEFAAFQVTCSSCNKRHTIIRASFSPKQRKGIVDFPCEGIMDLIHATSFDEVKEKARLLVLYHLNIDINETSFTAPETAPPKEEQH
jgi:hypothetical protein